MKQKSKQENIIRILLIIIAAGSILAAIKCIFVGLQRDEEYAITLSYRLIDGDRLLTQVWDPHQTSAFLLSAIEWIFIKVTGGTDYLVLFCRTAGTLIHFLITFFLYKTLRLKVSKTDAFLLSIIFFGILPKSSVLPEFSLMMSWFVTLMAITVIRMEYISKSEKKSGMVFLLILLSLFSAGLVLSYPTCVIVIPAVIVYLAVSRKKYPGYSIPLFVGVLAATGMIYICGLFFYMSPYEIFDNVKEALKSCGSHDLNDTGRIGNYLKDALILFALSLAEGIVAFVIYTIISFAHFKKIEMKKDSLTKIFAITAVSAALVQVFLITFPLIEYVRSYDSSYYFLLAAGALILLLKEKDMKNRSEILLVLIMNILGFLAVIVLTNLNIFTSVRYITSGIVFSLAAFVIYADEKNTKIKKYVTVMLIVLAFSITFFKGFNYNSDDGYAWNITKVAKLIRHGAGKGVLTEYMTGYMSDKTYEDWNKYINDGDVVLVWDRKSLCYFFKDVEIGSYSTISTPTYYVDSLEKYWENNPDKYPNVIAVSCWWGDYRMEDFDNFLGWIENEYCADTIVDGDYYRYYIKND